MGGRAEGPPSHFGPQMIKFQKHFSSAPQLLAKISFSSPLFLSGPPQAPLYGTSIIPMSQHGVMVKKWWVFSLAFTTVHVCQIFVLVSSLVMMTCNMTQL